MKKKCLLFVVLPLLVTTLVSCQKEGERPHLTYGNEMQISLDDVKELNNDELLIKTRDEKEVFLLATYQGTYSEDCLCWSTFKDVIVHYMNYFNRVVYLYNAQNQDESLKHLKIAKVEQSTPFLYIFNGENKLASFSYSNPKDKAIFEDRKGEALKTRVDQIVDEPLLYYMHPEEIEYSTSTYHRELLVIFIRSGCGDCKYVLPNVIIPYINSHKLEDGIRIVDLQPYYDLQNEPTTSSLPYDGIKDICQLSEESNELLGYGKGVVPTIQYYKEGNLIDASVYFNDEIRQNEDGSYYIHNSFYSKERLTSLHYVDKVEHNVLKGMSIQKDEVITTDKGYMYWRQEKAALYHTPLLNAFLDTYCK